MMQRFLMETDESKTSVAGKLVFDAGCGNGLLNQFMAEAGMTVVGMDLSESIVRAYEHNQYERAMFIQGDVQYPPLALESFDIVHCSGVLICTNNTELSFSCIDPCVKTGGKLSVWLYHPRKSLSHNLSNFLRRFTSKLPIRVQYYLYLFTLLPASYVLKKLKGNKQNAREMMVDILDWFSPQYRWEHQPDEAESWFTKRNYSNVKITTRDTFGFNIIGIKNK
jgi:2-polyprenyl-3-methyl-5-hydroxy-6-metoxy-1,4-benzoquinol methylase